MEQPVEGEHARPVGRLLLADQLGSVVLAQVPQLINEQQLQAILIRSLTLLEVGHLLLVRLDLLPEIVVILGRL